MTTQTDLALDQVFAELYALADKESQYLKNISDPSYHESMERFKRLLFVKKAELKRKLYPIELMAYGPDIELEVSV
ncbi:MAG: hypothetical protein KGH64_03280 [Candidatus Micrarchaeota archaeon]|nr:hypothetical protein [Candidatus Micrarchaeota archaeon]MDE1834335.1 hypothetical protein [Candidatus Micrarchaeota archaeon]MDE1859813.1 hypothetical protein [Candidatus Micrarchaeota archaeon]